MCQFYFENKLPGEAEKAMLESLKRWPDDAGAYHNLGTVHRMTNQNAKALAAYRKSLELRPNSPVTALYLGYALADGGSLREAAEAFRKVLQLDPRLSAAKAALDAVDIDVREQMDNPFLENAGDSAAGITP